MTPEDLWALERLAAPAVSPDGRWVVFTVTRYSVEENQGTCDLWVVPTDGGAPPRRLTWGAGGAANGSPVWSPDGRRIAFTARRGDAPPQLYVLPFAAGGEAQPVTTLPIAVLAPRWPAHADPERVVFLGATWPDLNDGWEAVRRRSDEQKADKTQAKIADSRLLRYWDSYRTDGRRHHVFAVDLATGRVEDLTPGLDRPMDFFTPEESWDVSPDGAEVAYSVNATDPPYREINFDVFIQPAGKTAEAQNLTAGNPAFDLRPRYSPDGRYLVYGRTLRPDIDPDFIRLARYDRRSGATAALAAGWDAAADGWTFTPDGGTLLFHAQERGRTHLWSLAVDGSEPAPRRLARGGVTGGASSGGAGRSTVVFLRQSLTAPPDLYALELPAAGDGEPRALSTWNASRLAGLDLGTAGEAVFAGAGAGAGAGGEPVHMHLVFPPGFDRGHKWPLLQVIHGGPHSASQDDFHWRWNAALLAARGYVVAMVNFHGSTGYGQAFADAILGNHADQPFEDVMKATDWLLAEGYVDETRMAAAGGSYGGYLVAWILGHSDRFAALVDHAGVYDLMAQFASDDTWGRGKNYGAEPWTDPARVDLYSPSRHAREFRTPTLVLHGEKDYRVPVTQGINLYSVLQGQGVPARLVLFPDENHWILKPQAALLWWREVFAWLERWLGRGNPTGSAG